MKHLIISSLLFLSFTSPKDRILTVEENTPSECYDYAETVSTLVGFIFKMSYEDQYLEFEDAFNQCLVRIGVDPNSDNYYD